MRLLPDEQDVDLPRRAPPSWVCHLAPARACVSLRSSSLDAGLKEALVRAGDCPREKVMVAPAGELQAVPQDHF